MKPVDPGNPRAYDGCEGKPRMFYIEPTSSTPRINPARPLPAIGPGKGVNHLKAKPTRFKVGIVTVSEKQTPKAGRTVFELRYVDPSTGKEVKRRVSGLDMDEIRAMAENLTRRAYTGRGYLAGAKAPTLAEGIAQAIRLSGGRPETKTDAAQRAKSFEAFMADTYPAARTWADLRPSMLEHYQRHCEGLGLAYDSIRLRLAPIKAAWRRMHRDWPETVKPCPALRLERPPRREIECLEPGEVATLLDWLKVHAPDLWPMATLQALCGLRVLEAASLRVQDVNLEAGTVTVTDTGRHTPKTRDSWRTVPVCGEALEAVKVAVRELGKRKVQPAGGELFTDSKGNPWKREALTRRWRRCLNHAAARPERIIRKGTGKPLTLKKNGVGVARLAELPPRKLRAAFATMAGLLGVQDRALKAYLGHAAGDMLGGHYRRIDPAELRAVSDALSGWRELQNGGDVRKDSGNIVPAASANS